MFCIIYHLNLVLLFTLFYQANASPEGDCFVTEGTQKEIKANY